MHIILYSGKDCCLCDQAEQMLNQVVHHGVTVEKIDVRASADLYHLYGARIPVLKHSDSDKELAWPFSEPQLIEFLS
jgi:hypothetical protein